MIRKLVLAVALSVGSFSAFGAACVALDYEEMKDMSADELAAQWCGNIKTENELTRGIFDVTMGGRGNADELRAEADKCRGQERRIERLVLQKDSNRTKEVLLAACRKTGKI